MRNSAKLISGRISTTYQDALQPESDSRPRRRVLYGRARGQSFLVAVGDVTVVLPEEVFSGGFHQAGERGAIGEFDIGGAALRAPGFGRRPRTPSLDGGGMLGGQIQRGDKDEANAPTWSAVVRGGVQRRPGAASNQQGRELSDCFIDSVARRPDESMGRYFNSDAQQSGKSSRRGGAIPPPRP